MNIFAGTATMFIDAARCACPNLRELVQACAGHVCADREHARYVISDTPPPQTASSAAAAAVAGKRKSPDNAVVYLRSAWILDSISIAKVKKTHAYVHKF